jgi:hypothetical protein
MFIGSFRDPAFPDRVIKTGDQYISDASYAEIVQKMPIPCTDILLIRENDEALYLVKRKVFPHPQWWTLGGRMMFNDESLEASAARCLKRESKIDVALNRFRPCGTGFYQWARTAQAEAPGKNLAILFSLIVTREEIDFIGENLDGNEFETELGIQRFSRERLVADNCHPVLIRTYDYLFQR